MLEDIINYNFTDIVTLHRLNFRFKNCNRILEHAKLKKNQNLWLTLDSIKPYKVNTYYPAIYVQVL